MKNLFNRKTVIAASLVVIANFAMVGTASAHCDGVDGPVIKEARVALDKNDVTPLLKWVPADGEARVKAAFANALSEKGKGRTAQAAAEGELFATLVRVHRESEGAPYTGVKPAGQIAPIVMEADAALDKSKVDRLAKHVAAQVEKSVREKFERAAHSRHVANQSVEKGREFVRNYVDYVHFVEGVNTLATAGSDAHGGAAHGAAAKPAGHAH